MCLKSRARTTGTPKDREPAATANLIQVPNTLFGTNLTNARLSCSVYRSRLPSFWRCSVRSTSSDASDGKLGIQTWFFGHFGIRSWQSICVHEVQKCVGAEKHEPNAVARRKSAGTTRGDVVSERHQSRFGLRESSPNRRRT